MLKKNVFCVEKHRVRHIVKKVLPGKLFKWLFWISTKAEKLKQNKYQRLPLLPFPSFLSCVCVFLFFAF